MRTHVLRRLSGALSQLPPELPYLPGGAHHAGMPKLAARATKVSDPQLPPALLPAGTLSQLEMTHALNPPPPGVCGWGGVGVAETTPCVFFFK